MHEWKNTTDLICSRNLHSRNFLDLVHMCQTQACRPNLARNVIIIGLRDYIKCASELARGLYHFKFNFSCGSNIKIWLFQLLCLSKVKVCFQLKMLNITCQLQLLFQNILILASNFTSLLYFGQ